VSRVFPKLRRFCAGSVPVLCRNCAGCLPFQCARFVPVSPGRQFLSQIEFLLAFMPRNFDDAFSPRSILRTKPILQSARLVLSRSGNDRYRNIPTQPGFNSLGMSCDNPSRGANPWTTLKRTAKTKSLRFVRLVSPFQPSRKVQCRARMVTQVSQSWSIRKESLRIDRNPAKLARHPVCLMPPRQRSLSQYPKG